jgi:hypothetical protein
LLQAEFCGIILPINSKGYFMKKFFCLISALLLSGTVFANNSSDNPHFYIQMQNQSQKSATISFSPLVGNVFLQPELIKNTPLPANEVSQKYGVYFDPLTTEDTFNIIFTGKNDCVFTVGYFAPADPTIFISGLGCAGAGYKITDGGKTLLLYISDIHAEVSRANG